MARSFANRDNDLVKWLTENNIRQADFAETIGTYQTTISRICRGRMVPTLELAVAIEDATGGAVSHRYWLEEREAQDG